MGDAVTCAVAGQKTPDGYYALDRMLTGFVRHGGQIACCGTCLDARGLTEDNLINQKLTVRLLQKLGHQPTVVANGEEAVDAVAGGGFDLVLMDCQMPEMDGFEATRTIRNRELDTGRHLPIVALTANAMSEDRERCLDAGMDDYISKPYSVADFQRTLDRWCRHQALPAAGNEK